MAKARHRDEQVEVADGQSLLTQPTALQPEAIADRIVDREHGDTVEEAGEDFHARYSATGRKYEYRIRNSAQREPHDFGQDRANSGCLRIARPAKRR